MMPTLQAIRSPLLVNYAAFLYGGGALKLWAGDPIVRKKGFIQSSRPLFGASGGGKACFVEDEDGNVGHMHSISSSSGSPDFIHVSFVHKITAATYTVLHS